MGDPDRLVISAEINNLERVCDFVSGAAQRAGLDEEAVHRCRLSVEEIVTNVIEHGYWQNVGSAETVEIRCTTADGVFKMTVIDNAPLFNPLALPDPDPSTPLWERQGGGWGIYFVKRFMDRVTYSDHGQRNHLTMEKRIEQPTR
jgi:anti-sigma regulatory factor (Ser/Thr protein kinase)